MEKQKYFGGWGVIVQYDQVETGMYWFNTKKEAIAEYRKRKKENTLTFIVRQIYI